MIGQYFANSRGVDVPSSGFRERLFQFFTDVHLGNFPASALPACSALVAIAPQKISFVAKKIRKTRNVKSIGPAAKIIFVFKAVYGAAGAQHVMMVHYIITQLTRTASQTSGPYIGGRIHEHPGTVERRCIEENDF